MPYRRRYRRRRRRRRVYRKRRYRRRRRRRNPMQTIQVRRMPMLFPDNALVNMRFSETVEFNLAVLGVGQEVAYSGNSIQDPALSGFSGHVLGYDQYREFYKRYCVYSTSINIQWYNNTTDLHEVWVRFSDQLTQEIDPDYIKELPGSKVRLLNIVGGRQTRLYHKAATKVARGESVLSNFQDYSSSISGSPAIGTFWHFGARCRFAVSTVSARVTINYKVRLFRRDWTLPESN